MDYQALWTELTTDPETVGYVDPTNSANDLANVGLINENNQTATRDTLNSALIYEKTDVAEFQALTDTQKAYVRDIWGLGDNVDVSPGSKARTVYVQVFGGTSNTAQALVAELNYTTSRANILGLGRVIVSDIEIARNRYGG